MRKMKYLVIITLIAGLMARCSSYEISAATESAKIDVKPETTELETDSTDLATGVEIVDGLEDMVVIECNTAEPKQESKFSDEDSTAYEYYEMLPADIRRSFEDSGWIWYVYEDASLASKYDWGISIAGMTDWKAHEIAIDRRDESKSAIVHELGHWTNHFYHGGLQSLFINAVFDAEWMNLYNEFGGSICNYNTVEEFGASAFEYFILEPERLAAVAPYTYKLMAKFVNGDTTFTNMANNVYTREPQTVVASTDISRTGTCVNSFGDSVIEAKLELVVTK